MVVNVNDHQKWPIAEKKWPKLRWINGVLRSRIGMPAICGGRLVLFGRLLYDEGRFAEAREAFVTAHEAVEALRGEMEGR